MSYIILEGPLPEELPVREDGSAYPFALVYLDRTILAETRTELVGQLIPDYQDIAEGAAGDAEALWSRYSSAVAIAGQWQQVLAANATEEGTFDTAVETEEVLTAIFTPREEKPVVTGPWEHKVPLILVRSSYVPYTSVEAPEGNIQWVDPYTETTFMDSLAALGVIETFAVEGAI